MTAYAFEHIARLSTCLVLVQDTRTLNDITLHIVCIHFPLTTTRPTSSATRGSCPAWSATSTRLCTNRRARTTGVWAQHPGHPNRHGRICRTEPHCTRRRGATQPSAPKHDQTPTPTTKPCCTGVLRAHYKDARRPWHDSAQNTRVGDPDLGASMSNARFEFDATANMHPVVHETVNCKRTMCQSSRQLGRVQARPLRERRATTGVFHAAVHDETHPRVAAPPERGLAIVRTTYRSPGGHLVARHSYHLGTTPWPRSGGDGRGTSPGSRADQKVAGVLRPCSGGARGRENHAKESCGVLQTPRHSA